MFYTVVVCEKCGRGETIAHAAGITIARSLARKYGWSVGRKKAKYAIVRYARIVREEKRGEKRFKKWTALNSI